MGQFYVYEYLRSDGTPYYIGKGKEARAFHPYYRAVATPKDKERIRFVATELSEPDALQAEMFLIFMHGRKDKRTGCLRNLTDGGEGTSGHTHTDEWKLAASKRMKGHIKSPLTCSRISSAKKGKPVSLAQKQSISRALKGRLFSDDTRQLISAAKRNVPLPSMRGSGNPRAKVTDVDVIAIRNGSLKERTARENLGLSHTQFYRLKRGEQWQLQST
jgi:hypothetical protein